MKKDLSVNDVVLCSRSLQDLPKKGLRGKNVFLLDSLSTALAPHAKSFESTRNEMITKLGSKNEKGEVVIEPGSENYLKFIEELNELLASMVSLELPEISQEIFDDIVIEKDEEVAAVLALKPFFKEKESVEK